MLIGLSAKNAILIVEFAKIEYEKGRDLVEAALVGARLRLRPILMTSFAFILGCVPLWIATGSGAASRRILGTVVIVGMLAATGIAIFVIPALFVMIEKIARRMPRPGAAAAVAAFRAGRLGELTCGASQPPRSPRPCSRRAVFSARRTGGRRYPLPTRTVES